MPHQENRFLLLEGLHQSAVPVLKRAGFARVELLPDALEGNAPADALQRADVVGIRSHLQLTYAVLQAVGCFCTGTNQVALNSAQALGITGYGNAALSLEALDVFPVEPKFADEALESPLRGLDNVIPTPHIGSFTIEAQANISLEVAGRFIQYLKNGTVAGAVNFPEVSLPLREDTHCLLHIHENQPKEALCRQPPLRRTQHQHRRADALHQRHCRLPGDGRRRQRFRSHAGTAHSVSGTIRSSRN